MAVKLPTAAQLNEAALAGRLPDVALPNGQKLGDWSAAPPTASAQMMTPLGKTAGECTRDEVAEIGAFYEAVAAALDIHGLAQHPTNCRRH